MENNFLYLFRNKYNKFDEVKYFMFFSKASFMEK